MCNRELRMICWPNSGECTSPIENLLQLEISTEKTIHNIFLLNGVKGVINQGKVKPFQPRALMIRYTYTHMHADL